MSKTLFWKILRIIIPGAILVLLFLRFVGLDNDPPLFYVGHGQAQLTDPYHLTFSARNNALFDEWNPFGYHRWEIFKHSLVSGVSHLLFSAAGVSRITANLAAVLLHLGGFVLFLLGLYTSRGIREALIAAFLLLINSSLFFYGRLPFLENGLIFLSGLTFFVFVRNRDRIWGQALTGVLIALAALSGKLFGLILVAPVILTLVYVFRSRVVVPALTVFGGVIVGAGAYIVTFYGGSVTTLLNYYSEQTVGMYGSPPGFDSPISFLRMLMTYGGESGLHEYTPFLFLLISFSLLICILVIPWRKPPTPEFIPLVFCVGWLLCGVAGLMPFYHRPLRYGLFLFLPASAICAYAVQVALSDKLRLKLQSPAITLLLLLLVNWYMITQCFILVKAEGGSSKVTVDPMGVTLLLALIVSAGLYFWLRKGRTIAPRRTILIPIVLLFVALAARQGAYLYRGLGQTHKQLALYNEELSGLIDNRSVITGPYTAALTIDNELQGVIYMFGLSNVETELFSRFPITHIVCDQSNWLQATRDFPFLKNASRVLQMGVRNQLVDLYRIPGADSLMTDFERGVEYFANGQLNSALISFSLFTKSHPQSFFGRLYLAITLHTNRQKDDAQTIINKLLAEYPDSYMLHGFLEGFYGRLHQETGEMSYLELADKHGQRAEQLNPDAAKWR
jgi:4-amino-4-deoxy-L-arabinose transferase-like glycosyltransferase